MGVNGNTVSDIDGSFVLSSSIPPLHITQCVNAELKVHKFLPVQIGDLFQCYIGEKLNLLSSQTGVHDISNQECYFM